MTLEVKTKDLELWIFQYLWVIILLPKALQFMVYFGLLGLILLKKQKVQIRPATIFIVGGSFVQIISIIRQCIITDPSMSRVAAALNTSLIWVLGAVFYTIFATTEPDEEFLNKIIKAIKINLIILVGLWLFSLISPVDSFSIAGHTWQLRRMDYLSSGITKRFSALTETVLGPSHILSFSLPLLFFDKQNKNRFITFGIILASYIAVFATHSRMGALCCAAMVLIYFRWYIKNSHPGKLEQIFDAAVILGVIILIILFRQELWSKVIGLFNARAGSNDARFSIYRLSLQKMWDTSPLIGCGIKNMITMGNGYQFPYGSHSMYIGFLYKVGIIGTILYLTGFVHILVNIWNGLHSNKNRLGILLIILCYFGFLIFADLDGSNYVLISVFSVWGILSNQKLMEGIDGEENRTAV